jgi:hypothetical protein
MKLLLVAVLAGSAVATDKFFTSTEYPTCEVKADGHMYIKYHHAHPLHAHFACTHAANGACSCDGHPTHGDVGCKQMIMNDGKKFKVGGECVTLPTSVADYGTTGLGALLNGACQAGGVKTVTLGKGHFTLDAEVDVVGCGLRIEGAGVDETILDAKGQHRHFFVESGTLEVDGVTLVQGKANSHVPDLSADGSGMSAWHRNNYHSTQVWYDSLFKKSDAIYSENNGSCRDSDGKCRGLDFRNIAPYNGGSLLAGEGADVTVTNSKLQMNACEAKGYDGNGGDALGMHIALQAGYKKMAGKVTLDNVEMRNDHHPAVVAQGAVMSTFNLGQAAIWVNSAGALDANNVDISRMNWLGEGPRTGHGWAQPNMPWNQVGVRGGNTRYDARAIVIRMPRQVKVTNSKIHTMQCSEGCIYWQVYADPWNWSGYENLARDAESAMNAMPSKHSEMFIKDTTFSDIKTWGSAGIYLPAGSGPSWLPSTGLGGTGVDGWKMDVKIHGCTFERNWVTASTATQVWTHECYLPRCRAHLKDLTIRDTRTWYTGGTDHCRWYDSQTYHGCKCNGGGTDEDRSCVVGHKADNDAATNPSDGKVLDTASYRTFTGYSMKMKPCNLAFSRQLEYGSSAMVVADGTLLENISLDNELSMVHFRRRGAFSEEKFFNGPLTITRCNGKTQAAKGADGQPVGDDVCTHSAIDANRPMFTMSWDCSMYETGSSWRDIKPTDAWKNADWLANHPTYTPSTSCETSGVCSS